MEKNVQDNALNESNTPTAERSLCNHCYEFYGNPQNDNLCSKCHQELQSVKETPKKRRMQSTPEERAQSRARLEELIKELRTLNESIPEPTVHSEEKEEKVEEPEVPKQTDKSKCWKCTRKTGIMGFECKCSFSFCKMHRLPEDHDCNFDFVTAGKEKLKEANPVVAGSKLQKF